MNSDRGGDSTVVVLRDVEKREGKNLDGWRTLIYTASVTLALSQKLVRAYCLYYVSYELNSILNVKRKY